jgi:hypothetical protein
MMPNAGWDGLQGCSGERWRLPSPVCSGASVD